MPPASPGRLHIALDGRLYAVRPWETLSDTEHAVWLSVQVELVCPDLPPRELHRLTPAQLARIANLALGRELPPPDGSAARIDETLT